MTQDLSPQKSTAATPAKAPPTSDMEEMDEILTAAETSEPLDSNQSSPPPRTERLPAENPNKYGVPAKRVEREQVFYTVEDTNATQFRKAKEHQIMIPQPNGKQQPKTFVFKPGEATKMLQETALLFLDVSPAFRVRNSKGQIVRPRKFSKGEERTVTLKPHELVVSVTQVRKEVLWDLARTMPGGQDKFGKGEGFYPREDLEEFVISGGKVEEDDDGNPLLDVAAA